MMPQDNRRCRRIRKVLLNANWILRKFTDPDPELECYSSLKIGGLPDDYTIIGQPYFDPAWHAFVFHVEHESFDEVPFGEAPPVHEGDIHIYYLHSNFYTVKK